MNVSLTAAIVSRLAGDATLDGLLARSVVGDGSGPAVYAGIPVPPGAVLPYVVVAGPLEDEPDDTFDDDYRRVLRDVHCYAARPDGGGGSMTEADRIAERVRALLHRRHDALDPSGYRVLVAQCHGPVENDGASAFGRVVSLRCLVTQAAMEEVS